MTPTPTQSLLRKLPGVDEAAASEELAALPREARVKIVRQVITEARRSILDGERDQPLEQSELVERVLARGRPLLGPTLQPVINATGVMLHTNLGRAPLAEQAIAAMQDAARYTNVEMHLQDGSRGGRGDGVHQLLCLLSGAEAALVVNNCAAAVLLALTVLAEGGEVVVSRGELVEIGGSFRVPDIMARSGAVLREVGTTNRTRIDDYRHAINEETRGLLKVHASNFQLSGFVEETPVDQLAALAAEQDEHHRLFVMEDLGSATFLPLTPDGSLDAATPIPSVEAGADIVTFSGDKLLGGPQAGILLGRTWAISALRRHPVFRSLRPDKTVLAALEATLRLHLEESGRQHLPLHRMASTPLDALEKRASALCEALSKRRLSKRGLSKSGLSKSGLSVEITRMTSTLGGGSLPGQTMPSIGLRISGDSTGIPSGETMSAETMSAALRSGTPPVVGLIRDGALMLDLRTVAESEDDGLLQALSAVNKPVEAR